LKDAKDDAGVDLLPIPPWRDDAGTGVLRFQLQLFDEKSSGIGFISEFFDRNCRELSERKYPLASIRTMRLECQF